MSTITNISNHLEWFGLFQGEMMLEATLRDTRLIFVSDKCMKLRHPTILELIFLLHENGHNNKLLASLPDDIEFKLEIDGLLQKKMDEIVWFANDSRKFCGVLVANDMTVVNLAEWHSYHVRCMSWAT